MFARLTQVARKAAVSKVCPLSVPKKQFGSYHPPAEHPYFPKDHPLFNKWAYTRDTPNSTFADKFQHPMNYQGHVPVTPTSFSPPNFEGAAVLYEARPLNYPGLYFVAACGTAYLTTYLTACVVHDWLLRSGGIYLPMEAIPRFKWNMWQNLVLLQGGRRFDQYSVQREVKTVYETDEFQAKLEEYIAKEGKKAK